MPNIAFGSTIVAFALGVLVAMTPNVGAAQGSGAAKKVDVHKPTSAAKNPTGIKRRTAGKSADSDDVSRLEKAEARLRKDMQRIGGGKTPSQSISNVRGDISRSLVNIERLERAEKKSGMTSKEIEARRKKFKDQSIFNASDIPTTAGTTALQEGGKKAVSKYAGKWLGWYGWLLTAADYGTRYKIKQENIALMEELLKREHANREELSRMSSKLYNDLSDSYDRLKALKEMRSLYDKVTLDLAKAREPARSHANLKRVEDTAGDEEEIRKFKEHGRKTMRIEPANGARPAPPLRPGVHRSKHPAKTEEEQLRQAAAEYSDAQVALSRGPSVSGDNDAEIDFRIAHARLKRLADPRFTRSPRVRRLARSYLSRLPKRFVAGHAYTRGDQTAAADPDPRIRSTLKRGRYSKDAGDGGDGGDAD